MSVTAQRRFRVRMACPRPPACTYTYPDGSRRRIDADRHQDYINRLLADPSALGYLPPYPELGITQRTAWIACEVAAPDAAAALDCAEEILWRFLEASHCDVPRGGERSRLLGQGVRVAGPVRATILECLPGE